MFDVTGNGDSMHGAVDLLAHGGRIVFVGLVKTDFAKALYEDPKIEKARIAATPSPNRRGKPFAERRL